MCFGNGFNKPLSTRAIALLKQNIMDVIPCTELNEVNKFCMPNMVKRQKALYPQSKSIEMFNLKDDDLIGFLNDDMKKAYNLPYFEGIGIAIGDNIGTIENWNRAYETVICLVPKVDAEAYKYKVFANRLMTE
ncbi:MAG: hypothetical protein MJ237_08410 [bacterium]|nr:hypothetical protein [bacterium]